MTPTELWRQWSRAVLLGNLNRAKAWGHELRLCGVAPDWTTAQCSAFRVWWAVKVG